MTSEPTTNTTSTGPSESPIRPNSVLAVDVVVFTVRPGEELQDAWQVLLVRSSKPIFEGKRALPFHLVV